MCDMAHSYVEHDSGIRLFDMAHSYVWYQSHSSAIMEALLQKSPIDSGIRLFDGDLGGWGRVPFSRNFMKPTPRRKWYLKTGRRFH